MHDIRLSSAMWSVLSFAKTYLPSGCSICLDFNWITWVKLKLIVDYWLVGVFLSKRKWNNFNIWQEFCVTKQITHFIYKHRPPIIRLQTINPLFWRWGSILAPGVRNQWFKSNTIEPNTRMKTLNWAALSHRF